LREGSWTGPGASKSGAPPDSAPRDHYHASKEPNDPAGDGRREAKLDNGKRSGRCIGDEPDDQPSHRPDHACTSGAYDSPASGQR